VRKRGKRREERGKVLLRQPTRLPCELSFVCFLRFELLVGSQVEKGDGEWGIGDGVLLRKPIRLPSELPFICFLRSELTVGFQVIYLSLIVKSRT
jgi:hypothetical protein